MKVPLSRPEKVAMLKTLAVEYEEKQRDRVPLNPRPRPTPPSDPVVRERAKELRCMARAMLCMLDCEVHGDIPREERNKRYRHIIELCNESLAADATIPYAITHRCTAHYELDMLEESADDAAWAEQLIRESSGPLDTDSLSNALYLAGTAKLMFDWYELVTMWPSPARLRPPSADLHLAQALDPNDPRMHEKLAEVHTRMARYKARFAGDLRKERCERIARYKGFGLSPYGLALLDEAGLMPWVSYVKHILNIVNAAEKDVPTTKLRDQYSTTQCHNCWVNKYHSKLFLCSRCRRAMYCSKECQQAAWKGHKASCKMSAAHWEELKSSTLAPAPNCDVPDQPTNSADLASTMLAWLDKHRVLLSTTLIGSLCLSSNPGAHLTRGLRVTMEWMPGPRATAYRFRVVEAALLDFSDPSFREGRNSKLELEGMEASEVLRGKDGAAMMTLPFIPRSPPSTSAPQPRRQMPVVNAPTWFDWPVLAHGLQRYGHFVLFRFDLLASVAVLDDAEASRAASQLPQDWFLGIVTSNAGFMLENSKGVHLLNLSIFLVGVGPSEPVHAAIPFSPAPQMADGHPPIQLPSELPWPNLYAHSFYTLVAVISRIHDGPDHFSDSLTDDQLVTLNNTVSKDLYHQHDDIWEEMVKNAASQPPRSAMPEGSDTGSEEETDSGGSEDFMLSEDAQLITTRYQSRRLYVELWLDPASCPGQPAPPSACEALKTRLDEIAKEWYDRKIEEAKARRSQLIMEWNQRVRESGGEQATIQAAEYELEEAVDDAPVLPEDAVDYRTERARKETVPDTLALAPLPTPSAKSEGPCTNDMPGLKTNFEREHGTGVIPSSVSPGNDNKSTSNPTVHASSRLASTKQATFQWLRGVIPRAKARFLRTA
ncbi:hypothetical protein AURDEDRAFT_128511 [Auricularia subglabra TFB-10046 SS5]|uniref:MYND-type domain-containing protein n=1 Tax=Auricularia subglabra (strain TFB-10046 / SS5) TaxID=717982 RepID=J0D161_AURST|nr:hypothetical protein AURDEDRAFT_128511 [Auricularia subglabra TFB-10046 SS5]